jgi:hypothetical protein
LHNAYNATNEIQKILDNKESKIKLTSRITTIADIQKIGPHLLIQPLKDDANDYHYKPAPQSSSTQPDNNTTIVKNNSGSISKIESTHQDTANLVEKQETEKLVAESSLEKDQQNITKTTVEVSRVKEPEVEVSQIKNPAVEAPEDEVQAITFTKTINIKPDIKTIFTIPTEDQERQYQETKLYEQQQKIKNDKIEQCNKLVVEQKKLSTLVKSANHNFENLKNAISIQHKLEINRQKLINLEKNKNKLESEYTQLSKNQHLEDIIPAKNKLDIATEKYNKQKLHYDALLNKYNTNKDLINARQQINKLTLELEAINNKIKELR